MDFLKPVFVFLTGTASSNLLQYCDIYSVSLGNYANRHQKDRLVDAKDDANIGLGILERCRKYLHRPGKCNQSKHGRSFQRYMKQTKLVDIHLLSHHQRIHLKDRILYW